MEMKICLLVILAIGRRNAGQWGQSCIGSANYTALLYITINSEYMNVYYHIMKQKQNISFKEINDTELQILLLHFSSASAILCSWDWHRKADGCCILSASA